MWIFGYHLLFSMIIFSYLFHIVLFGLYIYIHDGIAPGIPGINAWKVRINGSEDLLIPPSIAGEMIHIINMGNGINNIQNKNDDT